MKNFYFILLAILEPWVEYCSKKIFVDFFLNKFLQKTRLVFTVNCICSRSIWLWCKEGVVTMLRQKRNAERYLGPRALS